MIQPSALVTQDTPADHPLAALHYYKNKIRGCLALPRQVPVSIVELGQWAAVVRDDRLYKLEGAQDIYEWMHRQFQVRETQCKKLLCIGEQLTPEEIAPLVGVRKLGLEMLHQIALVEKEHLRPVVYERFYKLPSVAALSWAREQAEAVQAEGWERAAARLHEALEQGPPPKHLREQLQAQLLRLRGMVAQLKERGEARAEQVAALERTVELLEQQVAALEALPPRVSFPTPAAEPPPSPAEPPPPPAPEPVRVTPRAWAWLLRAYAPPPPPPLPRDLTHQHPMLWCDELLAAVVYRLLSPGVYWVASLYLVARLALFKAPIARNPLALAAPPADLPVSLRGELQSWQMLLSKGMMLQDAGKHDAALGWLERSLLMAESMEGDASPAVVDPLIALARHASHMRLTKTATDYVRRALPFMRERGFEEDEIAAYAQYVVGNDAYLRRSGSG